MSSPAYKVSVDGQPVFVHRFLTYNQFQWMDYASFATSGPLETGNEGASKPANGQ